MPDIDTKSIWCLIVWNKLSFFYIHLYVMLLATLWESADGKGLKATVKVCDLDRHNALLAKGALWSRGEHIIDDA